MVDINFDSDEGKERLLNLFFKKVIVYKDFVRVYLTIRKDPYDVPRPSKKAENKANSGCDIEKPGSPFS